MAGEREVEIDLDALKAFQGNHTLSIDLITTLHNIGICHFSRISRNNDNTPLLQYSVKANKLGLISQNAIEWDVYLTHLFDADISIHEGDDILLWEGNMKKGNPSFKDIYNKIPLAERDFDNKNWFQAAWRRVIPSKLIFFC